MGCTLAQGTLVSDLLLKAEGKEAVLRGSAVESGDRSQRRLDRSRLWVGLGSRSWRYEVRNSSQAYVWRA